MAQIVVVEDDVYMREELIDVLKKAGYDAVPLLDFENAVDNVSFPGLDFARHQSSFSLRL
mgnify:CR=1 FL=1